MMGPLGKILIVAALGYSSGVYAQGLVISVPPPPPERTGVSLLDCKVMLADGSVEKLAARYDRAGRQLEVQPGSGPSWKGAVFADRYDVWERRSGVTDSEGKWTKITFTDFHSTQTVVPIKLTRDALPPNDGNETDGTRAVGLCKATFVKDSQ